MFIWIFRLTVLLLVAGCVEGTDVTAANFGIARSAQQTIAVANRSVVIGGPPGYCIDRSGSKLNGDSAFVLLANCASITQTAQPGAPQALGLLTASVAKMQGVGPSLLATPGALEGFVGSERGRAAMARDGRAQSVEIMETRRLDDAFLIRLRDRSQSEMAGVEDVYWRGLAELNGRLVTISVVSFADRPLSAGEGLIALRSFLARIRAETPMQVAVR